jgi:hypothetical protein
MPSSSGQGRVAKASRRKICCLRSTVFSSSGPMGNALSNRRKIHAVAFFPSEPINGSQEFHSEGRLVSGDEFRRSFQRREIRSGFVAMERYSSTFAHHPVPDTSPESSPASGRMPDLYYQKNNIFACLIVQAWWASCGRSVKNMVPLSMRSVPSERRMSNAFATGLKPMQTFGRNSCQIARSLEDTSRIIWAQCLRDSPGLSQVLFPAGRCSDHKKGFHRFHIASRQYFALPHCLHFRAWNG